MRFKCDSNGVQASLRSVRWSLRSQNAKEILIVIESVTVYGRITIYIEDIKYNRSEKYIKMIVR
tara:strand:- start:2022 stop:2213 length:192 start_codon:yes stop_codon:yes gene_type:complete